MHWAHRLLDDRFTLADRLLADRGGFFDHYTAPDAYLFWAFLRATRFGLKYLTCRSSRTTRLTFRACSSDRASGAFWIWSGRPEVVRQGAGGST